MSLVFYLVSGLPLQLVDPPVSSVSHPHMFNTLVDSLAEELDANRNGALTAHEIATALKGTTISLWLKERLDAKTSRARRLSAQPVGKVEESALLPVVKEKLADASKVLNVQERLDCIGNCIDIGIARAEHARGCRAVIFVGNTGAGKSTTVNYLVGCEMESVKKKDIGIKESGRVIRVKKDSEIPERTTIGHENVSSTFLPDIVTADGDLRFFDCPGFLDNRGSEINIANAVNIRTAIQAAAEVKVVVLLSMASIQADRGRGMREMVQMLRDLFGDTVEEHMESLLIVVTGLKPDLGVEVPGYDPDKVKLVKGTLRKEKSIATIVEPLMERVHAYDPLNRPIDGGVTRQELLDLIDGMRPIATPGEIFKTVLTVEDQSSLRDIASELKSRLVASLEACEYEAVYGDLKLLRGLDRIQDDRVTLLRGDVESAIKDDMFRRYNDIVRLVMTERFDDAKGQLRSLEAAASVLGSVGDCRAMFTDAQTYVQSAEDGAALRAQMQSRMKADQDEISKLQAQLAIVDTDAFRNFQAFQAMQARQAELQEQGSTQEQGLRETHERESAQLRRRIDMASTDEDALRRLQAEERRKNEAYAAELEQVRAKQQQSEQEHSQALGELQARIDGDASERERLKAELQRYKDEAEAAMRGKEEEEKRRLEADRAAAELAEERREADRLSAIRDEALQPVKDAGEGQQRHARLTARASAGPRRRP